jgi:hypothetical protein
MIAAVGLGSEVCAVRSERHGGFTRHGAPVGPPSIASCGTGV